MTLRIYRPAKNAMQSGTANSRMWRAVFSPEGRKFLDPLMGWVGTEDMQQQIQLHFASEAEAVDYAKRQNIAYEILPAPVKRRHLQAYADNFK